MEVIAFNSTYHMIHAILLFIIFVLYAKISLAIFLILGCLLGSKLPDIDHKRSNISRNFPVISFIVRLLTKHRGFTHSALAALLIFVLFKNVENLFLIHGLAFSVVIGYLSHLLADMSTKSGIPLFWPNEKRIKIPLNQNLNAVLWILLFGFLIWNQLKVQNLLNRFVK